jgi:hypothetical protein
MSRDRLVSVVMGLAIAALIGWIAANTYWGEVTLPTPLKGEAARNPFYAAARLAEKLGARTEWRRNLEALPSQDAVIVLWGWNWSLIRNRRETLERWVSGGGRLVLDRSLLGGDEDLERWAGLTLHVLERQAAEDEASECRMLDVEHPTPLEDARRSYSVCGLDQGTSLASTRRANWILRDSHGVQAVRVPIGRGSVTMVNAKPFVWRDLFEFDHAILFAAATQIRRGDQVLFLSEEEGTSLFALMWRHGAAAILLSLALIAALLWRGAVRFGPLAAAPDPARRSLAEQILGTGRFTLRVGKGQALHAAAVRALREAADRRIPSYSRLPAQERIHALARASRLDGDALSAAIHFQGTLRGGELRSALALLEAARRSLLTFRIK